MKIFDLRNTAWKSSDLMNQPSQATPSHWRQNTVSNQFYIFFYQANLISKSSSWNHDESVNNWSTSLWINCIEKQAAYNTDNFTVSFIHPMLVFTSVNKSVSIHCYLMQLNALHLHNRYVYHFIVNSVCIEHIYQLIFRQWQTIKNGQSLIMMSFTDMK